MGRARRCARRGLRRISPQHQNNTLCVFWQAAKGLGTDEAEFQRVLVARSKEHLQALFVEYEKVGCASIRHGYEYVEDMNRRADEKKSIERIEDYKNR